MEEQKYRGIAQGELDLYSVDLSIMSKKSHGLSKWPSRAGICTVSPVVNSKR